LFLDDDGLALGHDMLLLLLLCLEIRTLLHSLLAGVLLLGDLLFVEQGVAYPGLRGGATVVCILDFTDRGLVMELDLALGHELVALRCLLLLCLHPLGVGRALSLPPGGFILSCPFTCSRLLRVLRGRAIPGGLFAVCGGEL